jgi:curved DNA-binding protein CbpA
MNTKIMRYYKIFNLDNQCSDLELRRAYRKLALIIHPDKCGENTTNREFETLNRIYLKLVKYRRNNKCIF